MDEDGRRVDALLRDLERAIASIDQRLTAVERAVAVARLSAGWSDQGNLPSPSALSGLPDLPDPVDLRAPRDLPAPSDRPAPPALPALPQDGVALLSFVGRTFVALGGAYVFRALTDAAIVPLTQGSAMGLTYALGWLVMSDRAGAAGRRTSAAFHGLVAAMIAFPLILESVTRFQLLTPSGAALGLLLATALMLAAALRQRSPTLAWIGVIAALGSALALVTATGVVLPFAAVTIALGVATLWIGYSANWVLLRWPVALVADLMVIALTARVASRSWPDPPARVIALQLLLLTGYLASVATRTLLRGRDVVAFEVVQTAAALAVGFGGALYVTRATGSGAVALAAMSLLVGAACYAVAFAFLGQQGVRRNFYFYTSLGLILVLISSALLMATAPLALAWSAVAVAASWLALRNGRVTLNAHAAVYIVAAAAASGVLAAAAAALVGAAGTPWPPPSPPAFAVLTGLAACVLVPQPRGRHISTLERVPRLAITIAFAWSAAGALVGVLAAALPHGAAPAIDAGALATVRTCVLAIAALVLAWAGRSERFRESGWLLYPALAAGGVKLLVDDLPRSRPATLFIALALYGGALIVAPRLGRPRASAAAPPVRT